MSAGEELPVLLRQSRDADPFKSYKSFLSGRALNALSEAGRDEPPDSIERVAFRSFDRQWCLADRRVIDMPRPALWRSRSGSQVFLVSLPRQGITSGPYLVASADVPDLNAFNNRGGLVYPLLRDGGGLNWNLADGVVGTLAEKYNSVLDEHDFVCYLYGCLGTPAAFEVLGAMGVQQPAVPITAAHDLFVEVVGIGRELLWLHTWGERYKPADGRALPSGSAKLSRPPTSYPNDFSYAEGHERLLLGDGVVDGVSKAVWEFEISGFQVVRSWLGYRMADRKGKKSSPLDDIRPSEWAFSDELLGLLAILERTIELTPAAADLLRRILEGDLIHAAELSEPADYKRKPPKAR
jgi:hypothetical protein